MSKSTEALDGDSAALNDIQLTNAVEDRHSRTVSASGSWLREDFVFLTRATAHILLGQCLQAIVQ